MCWNTRLFTAVGWFTGRSVPRPPSSEGCYYTPENRDITRQDRSRRNWETWDKAEGAICLERSAADARWQPLSGLPSGTMIQPVDFFPIQIQEGKSDASKREAQTRSVMWVGTFVVSYVLGEMTPHWHCEDQVR